MAWVLTQALFCEQWKELLKVSAGEGNSAGEGPASIRVACSGSRVEASCLLFASGLIPVVDFEVF